MVSVCYITIFCIRNSAETREKANKKYAAFISNFILERRVLILITIGALFFFYLSHANQMYFNQQSNRGENAIRFICNK